MTNSAAGNRTADHYKDQWDTRRGFREFIQQNPLADAARMVHSLPFDDLFERIRTAGGQRETRVYDAACGWADMMHQLLGAPAPSKLSYLGADINPSVLDIRPLDGARLIQWDISEAMPGVEKFDYVLCRAALHHTPDPGKTLRALVSHLNPGGTIMLSVYTKKAPLREAADDAMRETIVPMPNAEAWAAARQFSELGRDLRRSGGRVEIENDLPILGIKAGTYDLQTFIYDHFVKCWYNEAWGLERSNVVNFDWYHPPYAFRYSLEEFRDLVTRAGLTITKEAASKAQLYCEATIL